MDARRRNASGFTLTELMVVVTIVAILAVLATAGIRSYMLTARAAEASAMIQSIRAAQEGYRSETNAYLDVSSAMNSWYPRADPDADFVAFKNVSTHADVAGWNLLSPTVPGNGVRWVYTTKAGPPGTNPPAFSTAAQPTWTGTRGRAWYVVQARGDTDGDDHDVFMAASSMSDTLYSEAQGD